MKTATDCRLPRLLTGVNDQPVTDLEAHLALYGPLSDPTCWAPREIIDVVEQSGLRGHGGASFPVARKVGAVASRPGPRVVVANGTEGEPASKKDRVLMRELPHLVIDGAVIASRAVGAGEAIIAFSEADARSAGSLALALRQRSEGRRRGEPGFELVGVPGRLSTVCGDGRP